MRAFGRLRRSWLPARPTAGGADNRSAHQAAVTLGAGPLRREIELLAQRGRLHLEEPVDTTASPQVSPSPAASPGLTQREVEVLTLIAEGSTNRQIGQALFITPKTASVHVSRILAKPRVAGRGEAAAIAHRLGLDKHRSRLGLGLLSSRARFDDIKPDRADPSIQGSGQPLLHLAPHRQHPK
jgi:DNA-binding CsgD family transcriptional regulator